jgi:hypothetical protein
MSTESFGRIRRTYPSTPAQKNDDGSPGIGRRAAPRLLKDYGALVVSVLTGVPTLYYTERMHRMEKEEKRDREASELLDRLIGKNGKNVSVATVPAVNHPNVLGQKNYFSQSGQDVSSDYSLAVLRAGFTVTNAEVELRKEDTAVAIGSRLANTLAEKHLGPAHKIPRRPSGDERQPGRECAAQMDLLFRPGSPAG